jgi:acetyl-CoA/propionyl-CoA carboxylase biotin carboxyl carrier protein
MTTGVDIVREQVKIAAGEPLSFAQDDVVMRGHAIECRINAEDATKNFAPAPGTIAAYREPSGPFVRVDSGVEAGSEITPLYDPMVAKLIVWDVDREASTRRMLRALNEFEVSGVKTLIPFHLALLGTDQWARGETCRDLTSDKQWLKQHGGPPPPAAASDAAQEDSEQGPRLERDYAVEVSGKRFEVKVIGAALENGATPAGSAGAARSGGGARKPAKRRERGGGGGGAPGEIVSPLQGTVLKVAAEKGARVEEGALICVIEAMKMENEISAPVAGTVEELPVSEGGSVSTGDTIAVIK